MCFYKQGKYYILIEVLADGKARKQWRLWRYTKLKLAELQQFISNNNICQINYYSLLIYAVSLTYMVK